MRSGAIELNDIGSGQVQGFYGRGHIGAGTVGGTDLAEGGVWSGHITSGVLCCSFRMQTAEMISGFRAVHITTTNKIALADATVGAKLPAAGVCPANWLSGELAEVFVRADLQSPQASLWSGWVGTALAVGTVGRVVPLTSLLSGYGWQRLGIAFSGGMSVNPEVQVTSGGQVVHGLGTF